MKRLGTVLVALTALATTGLTVAPATASPIGDYPMVVDVSFDRTATCSGPVPGTLAVYFPPGSILGGDVEWRVRDGDRVLRTGTMPTRGNTTTAAFELADADIPDDGEVQVDARLLGPPGIVSDFGKVWRARVNRDCDPVRVVAVGDSVVWGQGLDHDQKFPYLTARDLGATTGRGFDMRSYAISGAVLDAPNLPAGNNDSACLELTPPQDLDGSGTMVFGEVTDQMPDVFCQLEKAGANAAAEGSEIDLVIMNGGINDLDPFFGVPAGITPGSEDLPAAVEREIGGVGAAQVNPARDFPLFSGSKVGYGGRGMREAIEKAHRLPGNPKVIVANYYYGYDTSGLPEQMRRFTEFVRLSSEANRQAAAQANSASADGPYAVAADGLFTLDNALLGRDPKLWTDFTGDNQISLRGFACPEFSPLPPQCLTAAVAHPDVAGSRQYADGFLLNPQVRDWFGLETTRSAGAGFTVSQTSGHPGVAVQLDASAIAAHDGIRLYEWYFGDGTKKTTTEPVITHGYMSRGPNLPRLVTTNSDGVRALYEAAEPVVID